MAKVRVRVGPTGGEADLVRRTSSKNCVERMTGTVNGQGALSEQIEADYHMFVIPVGCHWSDVIETSQQTCAKLDGALQRI